MCPQPLHTGNESVPKITINDTIKFFSKTAINILVISNHNISRVLFDKIASVYSIWKIYQYFSTGHGRLGEPALCQLYRHTFVLYVPRGRGSLTEVRDILENAECGLAERDVTIASVRSVPLGEHCQQHRHAAEAHRASRIALWVITTASASSVSEWAVS